MADAETGKVFRGNLARLVAKVQDERGLDLGQYRPAYLERRIASRLRSLDLHSYRQYADYLDSSPEEYAKLLDVLTINVTEFYRDAVVYDYFRQYVIPDMLAEKLRRRSRMIRVWSAGCATGEEPYSITMSLLEAIGRVDDSFLLTVMATDLDQNALEIAQRATYSLEKLGHIPKAHQVKYLEMQEDAFRIKPAVVRHVRFRQMDLFKDRPAGVSDIIFCRNVFIYFTREQQQRVLEVFYDALARGGYLVLGRSEKMAPSIGARLEMVNGRERIFRKPLRP